MPVDDVEPPGPELTLEPPPVPVVEVADVAVALVAGELPSSPDEQAASRQAKIAVTAGAAS
jgi:hypothetical protein